MSAQRFPTFDEFGRPNGTRVVDEGPGRARTGGTATTMPTFRGTIVIGDRGEKYLTEAERARRDANREAAARYRARKAAS